MDTIVKAIIAAVAWFGSGVSSLIASRILMFLAIKTLLLTLFAFILPIILNNFLHGLMIDAFAAVDSAFASSAISASGAMQFSGFTGWLVDCFMLPQCMSALISALSLHLFLKMIPFSPLK